MIAFYNENDPQAAAWLRELITANLIAPGVVDERSITEIEPDELSTYLQCHFFAGIGGWSYALRLAGWPDGEPVWTGSCPCQPFSAAGKRKGAGDERHLWPAFFRLIRECKPPLVFGEQVASADVVGTGLEADFVDAVSRGDYAKANGLAKRLVATRTVHYPARWLDGVFADLESVGYTCRTNDLPAACVNSPHIRQRLFWVANALSNGRGTRSSPITGCEGGATLIDDGGDAGWVGDTGGARLQERPQSEGRSAMGHEGQAVDAPGALGFWSAAEWLPCLDGKARRVPVEPAFQPLSDGVPARMVRLRGYGNSVVPQLAAEFIRACQDALTIRHG